MTSHLKRYFITGLLIVVPVYISVYVFLLIVNFMDSLIYRLPAPVRPDTYLPFHIPGLGILITVVAVFVVGVLATNFLGRKLVNLGERILQRIPLMRSVYKATKKFLETFFAKDSEGFRRVVLLEFPRSGLYAVGFVTSKTKGEVQERTGDETINVFIPTTPNPTSGYYFAVPEKDVTPLEMSVEEAFNLIMSGGVVVPDRRP